MPDRSDTPRHGGDLTFATRRYGEPADGWLDLSTGINPHPYPAEPVDPALLERLPDATATERLLAAATTAYGLPDGIAIMAVPGSELALRLLPTIVTDGPAAVLTPGYSSHTEAFRMAGRTVVPIDDPDRAPSDAAVVLVGNPNNPNGRHFDPTALTDLAHRLAKRGALLIVDEAYADIATDLSLLPRLDRVPALVLRSFGKFFGLPGLRLGFVAGPSAVVTNLGDRLGAWPVNTAAIAIGTAALADTPWQQAMRRRLADEMKLMQQFLADQAIDVIGGTDLFCLIEVEAAEQLHKSLAERGIWTRAFADAPRHLRLGLAPTGPALDRLATALAEINRSG